MFILHCLQPNDEAPQQRDELPANFLGRWGISLHGENLCLGSLLKKPAMGDAWPECPDAEIWLPKLHMLGM